MNTRYHWLLFSLGYCILHIVKRLVNSLHWTCIDSCYCGVLFCLYSSASICVCLLRQHFLYMKCLFIWKYQLSFIFHSAVEEFRHAWSLTLIKLYCLSELIATYLALCKERDQFNSQVEADIQNTWSYQYEATWLKSGEAFFQML